MVIRVGGVDGLDESWEVVVMFGVLVVQMLGWLRVVYCFQCLEKRLSDESSSEYALS